MRKAGIILVALVIGFILGAETWGSVKAKVFFNGNDFLAYLDGSLGSPKHFALGYIAGASDAFAMDYDRSKLVKFRKFTSDQSVAQISVIAEKFLRDNPQVR